MKRLKVVYILFFFLFASLFGYAQNNNYQPKFWSLMNIGGEFELYGQYKEMYSSSLLGEDKRTNSLYAGKIRLNTQSYFWHPNFLILLVDAAYNPGAGQNASILMPDYSIENSAKRLNVKANFFKNKKVQFSPLLNYGETFSNLENLYQAKSNYFSWGGHFKYSNRWLPLTMKYLNSKDEMEEKYSNRTFKNNGEELTGNIKKSIGKRDMNEFNFSQRNYIRELVNVYENENNTTSLNLRNNIFIDENKDYRLSSYISKLYQTGTYDYDRLTISENLNFNLPWNLRFNSGFGYSEGHQNELYSKNNDIEVELEHQWYESLNSAIYYNKTNNIRYSFNEFYNRLGFNVAYKKKLPKKGLLSLNYNYYKQDTQGSSGGSDITVFKEPYTLADGNITLLRNANVTIETVEVTDETGGLMYQENIDYILIKRDSFIEIQRIPGGLIPNNTVVYIDYTAMNLGDYTYKLASNSFMGSLSFFNNLVEVYYKYSNQDYKDVEVENNLVLQYAKKNQYGFKLNYKFVNVGFEKDDFESSVVPYRLTRYFTNLQGKFKNKVSYSLNGNYTNYDMIGEEGRKQKFIDVAANITYNINYSTQFDLRAGYRKQEGEGVDLNLLIGKAELSTIYRKLIVKLAADLYRKEHLTSENYDFNAINLRIIRKF